MTKKSDYIHDEWLVLRCKGGDDDALKELVDRWYSRVRRVVWRLTDGHADGADIVQEVWMTVVRKLSRLDDPAAYPQWLYRITTAKCADWVRKQRRHRGMIDTVANERPERTTPPAADADLDTRLTIRRALTGLSDHQRLILTMFYIDELSTAVIADALDIPLGTVKSRLHNARNELRRQIERIRP